MELIGRANLQTVGLFQEHARSQAPFLDRHCPASAVIRACPPPQTAQPAPHGVLVESHDLSPLGLPVFRRLPLPCMPTPLPRRNRWMLSLSRPTTTAFPKNETGRLPRLSFSRPAQRSLTFRVRSKCSAYPQVPMVAALLPSWIAGISADLKRNTPPQRRHRAHNRRARYRMAAPRQSGLVESPKQSIDDERGFRSSPSSSNSTTELCPLFFNRGNFIS